LLTLSTSLRAWLRSVVVTISVKTLLGEAMVQFPYP
jgi:hypothetical protein